MVNNFISTIYNSLLKVIKFLLLILSTVLVVVVFANVISRYFLHFSLAWADETARFLFIWISFLGGILAHAYSEHMGFDLISKSVPEKIGKLILIVSNIIVLIILGMIIKGGITMTIENFNWLTPALQISYGLVYSIVPISGIILAFQTLAKIYVLVKTLFKSNLLHN